MFYTPKWQNEFKGIFKGGGEALTKKPSPLFYGKQITEVQYCKTKKYYANFAYGK